MAHLHGGPLHNIELPPIIDQGDEVIERVEITPLPWLDNPQAHAERVVYKRFRHDSDDFYFVGYA